MNFMVKVKRGWKMGLISYEYILKQKKVLIFTIFSSVLTCKSVLTFLSFIIKAVKITPKLHQALGHHHPIILIHQHLPSSLFLAVGLIIVAQIINTFLHVALSHYVSNLFDNKEASLLKSIGRAFSRIFTIITWFLINYSVGQILNSLRNKGGIIGSLFTGLATLAWNILTFFVLPIIALEDLGVIGTIKQSEKSMRQTFGQNLGATFALKTASFILHSIATFIILLPAGVISYFVIPQPLNQIPVIELKFLIFIACVILALPFIIVSPLTSAAGTIFRVASYNYANKKPTGPFSTNMIQNSFVPKTAQ
jgi:hypothetical protein